MPIPSDVSSFWLPYTVTVMLIRRTTVASVAPVEIPARQLLGSLRSHFCTSEAGRGGSGFEVKTL